jgi:putative ABC transport system substrate-binding protein
MSGGQTRRHFLHRAGRVGLGAAGLALLGGCAVSPGQGSHGTASARVATIGYLGGITAEVAAYEAHLLDELRQELRELGWTDGENLRLEVRQGRGDVDQSALAAELVRAPVDVIVTAGRPSIEAAIVAARGQLPVVMLMGPLDTVERGLAASIQRPGGNLTGILQPPNEIYGKRLELLVEATPRASRVAYLGPGPRHIRERLRATAGALGVEVRFLRPQSETELERAFEAISQEAADALLVSMNWLTLNHRARIVDFAAQRKLPAMYDARGSAVVGGLLSYSVRFPVLFREAATYADRILRGAHPGELPIQTPTYYDLVLNMRAARAIGLTLPPAFLAQVDEVIE